MDSTEKVGDIKLDADADVVQQDKVLEGVQEPPERQEEQLGGEQPSGEQPNEEQPSEEQQQQLEEPVQEQLYNDLLTQCEKDEYLVKTIDWKDRKIQIITQNGKRERVRACKILMSDVENGPCPLVAISNVLFLRGDLVIQPADREVVNFDYLVDRLGDYLLNHAPAEEEQEVKRLIYMP